LVLCRSIWVSKCLSIFLVPSWSSNTPLYPQSVASTRVCPNFLLLWCFHFRFMFESIKEFGNVSLGNKDKKKWTCVLHLFPSTLLYIIQPISPLSFPMPSLSIALSLSLFFCWSWTFTIYVYCLYYPPHIFCCPSWIPHHPFGCPHC
jgi:hypothetical protein